MKNTNKTTKREMKALEKSTAQIEKSTAQINRTNQTDNIINLKARETMQKYIENGKKSKEFAYCLIELSNIICHSKLNKLMNKDTTYRKEFHTFKNDITANAKYNQYIDTLNSLYKISYNQNGDLVTKCTDTKRADEIYKQIRKLAGLNGSDIVSECYTKILSLISEKEKNNETITPDTLLTPFEIYNTNSKTYKNGTPKPQTLWTKTATNIIKEANKEVSHTINDNKSIREQTTIYTQLETIVKDEKGNDEVITKYKKAFSLSAYETTDINGKQNGITANESDNRFFCSIPERANLTARETYILKFHYMDNYHRFKTVDENGNDIIVEFYGTLSLQQIADKLRVRLSVIEKSDKNLKTKIISAGIFPEFTIEDRKTEQKAQKIACYKVNDENKTIIAIFESVGLASKILNIDKSNISKVLKGKRKSTNDLVFCYQDN